jgi:hypothetical protein
MSHDSSLLRPLDFLDDVDLAIGSGDAIFLQETQAAAILADFPGAADESASPVEAAAPSFVLLDDQAEAEHLATDSFEASIPDASLGSGSINVIGTPIQETNAGYSGIGLHIEPVDSGFAATTNALFSPAASAPTPVASANVVPPFGGLGIEAIIGSSPTETAIAHPTPQTGLDPSTTAAGTAVLASLDDSLHGSAVTNSAVGSGGATAAQVQQALDESGLSVNGAGIKVGVLSDSFNDLGGAAADEADGALPSASNIDVIKDLASGGTDEGRAMMQIIHDIAPGASLAFYTAFDSEQDFANGILSLAAAGAKVIVDDVSYFDEPFFQNGVVAQAIQTVEAEGVTYVTAAGNEASNGYQAAWTPTSGTFDGQILSDAENFGGSLVQNLTINTEGTGYDVPLVLEWNQAYGDASSDLEILVFHNGTLVGTATNRTSGEPTNPWVEFDFTASGTYQVAVENLSGPNPGLIKEITEGDGLPATISGANTGTVVGHSMTPGAITAGAVSTADTPAFGVNPPASETFSSSGAGTELLFANNGTALSSPDLLDPVAASGVDDIATTVPGGLSDFYGTSAASASLAGVAALILSADPNLTPSQVEAIMEETALPMANSAVSGAGLVQVDPAVAAALRFAEPVVIQTDGTTSLVQVGPNYFLDAVGSGTGPQLKYNGTSVIAGELGGWTPIGAIQTASGYDIAWKMAGADLYAIWSTDANGNYLSNLTPAVSGTSYALESYETTFHQDLNGDGTIGPTSVVIQTDGSTSLTQVANELFLYNGGVGPSLKYGGVAVTAGEFGGWTPIGAIQTASGYDIAWKLAGTTEYAIWSTDSNGNYTSNLTPAIPGNSTTLENFETIFHQDLNGDGVIGIPSATPLAATQSAPASQTSFDGQTLTLDAPPTFSGQLAGFGGDGTLTGSDQVDLRGFNFNTLHTSFNTASDTLSLSSGSNTASLQFLGQHTQSSFHFANDGDGGTLVVAATAAAQTAVAAETSNFAAHDTFVFAPDFGKITLPNFAPATDTLQFSTSVFANVAALLTATHDDGSGNAVITDAAHDTITLQHVTTAQLIAHQSDFHFV